MRTKVTKILSLLLGAAMLLSLSACGGGDKGRKTMAAAAVKAAQDALPDESLYSNGFLVFTAGEGKNTYVMMGFCYGKDGQTQEETAIGLFDGENLREFALSEQNPDEYAALLEAMPVNNKEEYAKSDLIEKVCKDSGIGTHDQAKKDLGIS